MVGNGRTLYNHRNTLTNRSLAAGRLTNRLVQEQIVFTWRRYFSLVGLVTANGRPFFFFFFCCFLLSRVQKARPSGRMKKVRQGEKKETFEENGAALEPYFFFTDPHRVGFLRSDKLTGD